MGDLSPGVRYGVTVSALTSGGVRGSSSRVVYAATSENTSKILEIKVYHY